MGELQASSVLAPSTDVRVREFDGELVLLDLRRGVYFALRGAGVLAWRKMEEGCPLDRVADEIAAHYNVAASDALRDLFDLGKEWLASGLDQMSEP